MGEWIRWSGLSYIEWISNDSFGTTTIALKNENPIELSLPDNIKLTVFPSSSVPVTRSYATSVTLRQRIMFSLEYCSPTKWQRTYSDALWFRRLVELGKGVPVNIDEALYLPWTEPVPEDSTHLSDALFALHEVSVGKGAHIVAKAEPHARFYLFTFSNAVECGAINVWYEKRTLLEPVIDLYSLSYSGNAPSHVALFLNLMQALETLHARFYARTKGEYRRRVDNLCTRTDDPNLRNYLWIPRQNQYRSVILTCRMNDLLFADGSRPIEPRRDFCRFYEYGQRLANARNYYTHYDANKVMDAFSQEELFIVNHQLRLLVEFHLTTYLGFDRDCIRSKIVELDRLV